MPTVRRIAILVMAASAIAAAGASGQDAHYWSQQYGTKSTLLGGAVIGSVDDLSATYYNPAALALVDNPSVLLSAQAFQYRNLTVENGAGANTDLSSTTLRLTADIVAGSFTSSESGGNRVAYSVITRQRFNIGLQARSSDVRDVIGRAPGDEIYGGEVLFDQNVGEYWAGVTWARTVAPNLAIGVTPYLAIREQNTRTQLIAPRRATIPSTRCSKTESAPGF